MPFCGAIEKWESPVFQILVGLLTMALLGWVLLKPTTRRTLLSYLVGGSGLVRDVLVTLLILASCTALGLGFNALREASIPVVPKEPYQIFVPCPESELFAEKRNPSELLLSGLVRDSEDGAELKPSVLLVDARTPEAFAQQHVRGSINVPYSVLTGVQDEHVEAILSVRGVNRILVVCNGWPEGVGPNQAPREEDLLEDDLLEDDLLEDDLLQDNPEVVAPTPEAGVAAARKSAEDDSAGVDHPPSEHLADELISNEEIRQRFFQVISVDGGFDALAAMGLPTEGGVGGDGHE